MRSNWKTNFTLIPTLQSKIPLKIYDRSSTILPNLLNSTLLVHNGKKFLPLLITESMLNHKVGEFILTRAFFKFTKKNKK